MALGDKSNRITITYNPERCLHTRSIWANCTLCMDSCPGGAIRREKNGKRPTLDLTHCMQCGQCLSACPLEAFDASDFTERQLVERIKSTGSSTLRCFLPYGELQSLANQDQPYQLGTCIAALSPGVLFELALNRSCKLVTDRCQTCPIFRRAEPTMRANVTGAFRMLHGIGKSKNLQETTPLFLPSISAVYSSEDSEVRQQGIRSSIRSLFGVRKRSSSLRRSLGIREQAKHVPLWRLRLRDTWNRNDYLSKGLCSYEWPELVVDKQRCVGCGVCMQMCPTGTIAQSLSEGVFTYAFVPGTCANCGLCISVCTHAALSRSYRSYEKPFEEQVRYESPAKHCLNCGKPVLTDADGPYCYFCAQERNRVPMAQTLREQLGIKSFGDLKKEKELSSRERKEDNGGNT